MLLSVVSLLVALSMLAGCSSASTPSGSSTGTSGDEKASVQKVVVGTSNTMPPYYYQDENDNLTGYDVEVLKALDERLEGYEFTFEVMDFNAMAVSLETGKIDIAAFQLVKMMSA